mmetsp:Transcript_874/g.868  ORF Transcript_874/g.868 Transcript_874/m.868 type:complete len:85 (-) Transcript_874:188-442(-)
MEPLRITSLHSKASQESKPAVNSMLGERKKTLRPIETSIIGNKAPAFSRRKLSDNNRDLRPIPRSAVFPYYITSQNGTKVCSSD